MFDHQAEGEHFWDWAPERNITTGAIRLTDYNFKKPGQAMEVDRLGDAAYAQGQIESFDYPGDYLAQDVGKIVAGLRMHQERGADRRNRAVGDTVSLRAGKRVRLSGDPVPGTGETYLCLSASHHFVSEAYGSGGQGSDGYSFTGSYALMPDTAPMTPPRRTPVPVVHGPQTAVVAGEGDRLRRIRPHPGAVPLGPGRGAFDALPGVAELGREWLGRHGDPADRHGGRG